MVWFINSNHPADYVYGMKNQIDLETITVEHNEAPIISQMPKKEKDIFLAALELAIKDYYIQQEQAKSV